MWSHVCACSLVEYEKSLDQNMDAASFQMLLWKPEVVTLILTLMISFGLPSLDSWMSSPQVISKFLKYTQGMRLGAHIWVQCAFHFSSVGVMRPSFAWIYLQSNYYIYTFRIQNSFELKVRLNALIVFHAESVYRRNMKKLDFAHFVHIRNFAKNYVKQFIMSGLCSALSWSSLCVHSFCVYVYSCVLAL